MLYPYTSRTSTTRAARDTVQWKRPTEHVAVPAKSNTPPLAPQPAPRAVPRQAEKHADTRQKSTASSPARPSTRARAARTSSAASARPCRSSRRPTQSRRRDAARRTHGVNDVLHLHACSDTRLRLRCVDDQIRLSCAMQCNAMQLCKYVHESCQVSRRPGCLILVDLPSFNVGFLFVLPPHSPLQALGCAGPAGLEV
jgi:hypothetical protein